MKKSKDLIRRYSGGISWMRKILLSALSVLALLCANTPPSHATDCSNGSIIYREDFGGNNTEDPDVKGSGIPACDGLTYRDDPNSPQHEDRYSIRKTSVSGYYDWYDNITDHTHPSDKNRGYFMQVDAWRNPCEFFHVQVDKVCEGSELYLSLFGTSVSRGRNNAPGSIRIVAEDAKTGNEIDHYDIEIENAKQGKWEEYGFSFIVPTGCESINYRIVNNADQTIDGGNDFCLDDIEIRACLPLPTITPKKGTSICLGESETLTGDMDNTINLTLPLTFTWYKSDTPSYNMADWEEVYTGKPWDYIT